MESPHLVDVHSAFYFAANKQVTYMTQNVVSSWLHKYASNKIKLFKLVSYFSRPIKRKIDYRIM